MKYKIIITSILCLFVTGCALQKPTETKPSDVQIENGTVFLINTDGNKTVIATSKPEDGTIEGHFNQYTYTLVTFSPNKQFVAMLANGWETTYLRIYDIKTKQIHDVNTENIYPFNYTWTAENLLFGSACQGPNMSFCPEEKLYLSVIASTPWAIHIITEYPPES